MGGSDAALQIEAYPTAELAKRYVGIGGTRVVVHGNLRKLIEVDENFAWKTTFGEGVYPLHKEWCAKFRALQIKLQKEFQEKRAATEKTKKKRKK